jgi:hypothetical protein
MALLGIGIAVFGLVWIVISHSRSGAEA